MTPEQLAASGNEDGLQKAVMAWSALAENRAQFPALKWLFHVNNGDRAPGRAGLIRGGRAKAMGVKKGVPDLCLPVVKHWESEWPKETAAFRAPVYYHGLFIEMKKPDGKVSPEQKEWLDHLNGMGYCARVCWGWEEARDLLVWYLT